MSAHEGWASFGANSVRVRDVTSLEVADVSPREEGNPPSPSNLTAVSCDLSTVSYGLCPMPYVSNAGTKTERELLEVAVAGMRFANQETAKDDNLRYIMENIVNPKLGGSAGQDPVVMLGGLVPHLHSAVCEEMAAKVAKVEVARTGYALPGTWDAYWSKAEQGFVATLDPIERDVYAQTRGASRTAFRICRDLAKGNCGQFFLSQGNLRRRIAGLSNGWRIIEQLRRIPAIRIVEKGEEWTTGKRPKATSFEWLLKDFSTEPPRRRTNQGAGTPQRRKPTEAAA